jgi:polyhydroxyalkanoate synthesis regulator phasin
MEEWHPKVKEGTMKRDDGKKIEKITENGKEKEEDMPEKMPRGVVGRQKSG